MAPPILADHTLFRSIFDRTPEALLLADDEARYVAANPAATALTGYSEADITGLSLEDLTPPDRRSGGRNAWRDFLSRGSLAGEYLLLRKNGSTVWVEFRAIAAIQPGVHLSTLHDITARKQVEEALRSKEEELSDFVDNAVIGLHWVDAEGRIVWANQAELDLLGYERDEYVGHWIGEFHADDAVIGELLQRLAASETLQNYEARLRCKDGSIKHVLISSNVRWRDGRFLHTRCFTRDITERKAAEAERVRLLAREHEAHIEAEFARRRLTALIENSSDAVLLVDRTGRIEFASESSRRLSGLGPEQLVGLDAFERIHPDDQPMARELLQHGLMNPGVPLTITCRVVGPDGSWRFREVLGVNRLDNPVLRGIVLHSRDITDAKQQEQALREANRLKDEFLATLSHELRTPLTAILGWARILRTRSLDPGVAHAVEVIERNATVQARLIEDILDVSRIVSGKLQLKLGVVHLADVVTEALESVKPAADAKGIAIDLSVGGDVPVLVADSERLQQVAWNLLSNAVKFTPHDGQVAVLIRRVDGLVELMVRDTGAGIRPEMLPFVFDRFRQADSTTTRTHGGLGLGLAIVRHIVESHGGTVQAESDGLGDGSTFTVRLPVRAGKARGSEDSGAVMAAQGTPAAIAPSGTAPFTALVVDDEADARELTAEILGAAGARVTTAASAAEALEILEGVTPDVVVVDIGMPQHDGYWLMQQIRQSPQVRIAGIPAVALTAYARQDNRERALAAGFQLHVAKPADAETLIAAVGRALEWGG